jgi:hypothetical protein
VHRSKREGMFGFSAIQPTPAPLHSQACTPRRRWK